MKSISQVSYRCVTPKRANKKSFFSKRSIQAKLNINQPGDVYEQEAEAIADKIIQIPDAETASTFFHPKPILTSSIQKKGSTETGIVAPTTSVEQTLNSTGQPIDKGTMSFMEQRFGYDFGNVQVHNNSSAHQSAADINAKAYTNGDHIVFGYGKYQPSTDFGKQLLAHELTHIIQQRENTNSTTLQKSPDESGHSKEEYVELAREAMAEQSSIAGVGNPSGVYNVLNEIDNLPMLIDVLVELGKDYSLDGLLGVSSPAHEHASRTESYVKAARIVALPGEPVTEYIFTDIIDNYGLLSEDEKSELLKLLRQNVNASKLLKIIYSKKIVDRRDTELGGVSVGNFDFSYNQCAASVSVRVKFDFDSSIPSKERVPYKTRFFNAIKNTWDNKYKLVSKDPACPCKEIRIRIGAYETTGKDEHKIIDVHNEKGYREYVFYEMNLDFNTSDNTMAHEFGHVLGQYDEYDGGWLENHMFWHDTAHISDKKALMNEGTELRERYFSSYTWEIQNVSPSDSCQGLITIINYKPFIFHAHPTLPVIYHSPLQRT